MKEDCLNNYAVQAGRVCDIVEVREGPESREACANAALMLSQIQPPAAVSAQCHLCKNSCFKRYRSRY